METGREDPAGELRKRCGSSDFVTRGCSLAGPAHVNAHMVCCNHAVLTCPMPHLADAWLQGQALQGDQQALGSKVYGVVASTNHTSDIQRCGGVGSDLSFLYFAV